MSFGSFGGGGFSAPGSSGGFGGGMFGGPIMGGTGGGTAGGGGQIFDTGNTFIDTVGTIAAERGTNRLLDEIGLGADQSVRAGAPPRVPGGTGQGSGRPDAPAGGERPGGSGTPGTTPIFRPAPRGDDSGGGERQNTGVIGDTASLTQNLVIGIALFFAYQLYTDLA